MRRGFIPVVLLGLLVLTAGPVPALAVSPAEGAPPIVWEHLFGGSGADLARSADQTADGGFVLLGETGSSQSGDVAGTNRGRSDLWVVRLDSAGEIQWQRLIGGSEADHAQAVRTTPDGGCVLLATTLSSAGGNLTGTNSGGLDTWVVKLDATGGIQWQQLIGGTEDDDGYRIEPTADGGYVIVGETYSNEIRGQALANHGHSDVWVLKLDAGGDI